MEISVGLIVQVIVGLLTVAAAYGALKTKLAQHGRDIGDLKADVNVINGQHAPGAEPLFVRRSECSETTRRFEIAHDSLRGAVEIQAASVDRLLNFARWNLTTKEGMTLGQANEILENGR
jgi:hypothetical protein